MRIYLSVVDIPDGHMVRHITYHDIGEHFTGDIPYPVKSMNPQLKEQMEFLEQRSMMTQLEYWDSFQAVYLTEKDLKLFKQIELVEMAEFGMDQVALGNNHGFIIADRCLRAVYEGEPSLKLAGYVIKRLNLLFRQIPTIYTYGLEAEWWDVHKWEELNESKSETSGRQTLQN
jgi:5'-deoxynucleotidase YfbR-like HD superfamily hydrolase